MRCGPPPARTRLGPRRGRAPRHPRARPVRRPLRRPPPPRRRGGRCGPPAPAARGCARPW
ncbi:hypothetical protein E1B22_02275 [Thermaerobacter sp. FW80]|nr:hypothetical protein E1B22_02275 [Thermaerobacter sp. FW80]